MNAGADFGLRLEADGDRFVQRGVDKHLYREIIEMLTVSLDTSPFLLLNDLRPPGSCIYPFTELSELLR